MDRCNLIQMIINFQNGDRDEYNSIKEYFKNKINKYKYKTQYEDIENEIDLRLLELIYKINVKNFVNDYCILKYINKFIDTSYIDINKKYMKQANIIDYESVFKEPCYQETCIKFGTLIDMLDEKEKKIILLKYMYQYKFTEIATILGESKQNVYYYHKKALKKNKFQLLITI